MGKLPGWVPDDEEIAGVIRGECWDVGGGDSRRSARAIRELLERKAGAYNPACDNCECQCHGKPDPAPVASETSRPSPFCNAPLNSGGQCGYLRGHLPPCGARRPERKDRP